MKELLKDLDNKKIYIYGAGVIARAVILALNSNSDFNSKNLLGCVVKDTSVNEKEVEGIRVYSIEDVDLKKSDVQLLLAVRDRYIKDITDFLKGEGIYNFINVDFKECIEIIEKRWIDESGYRGKTFSEYMKRDLLSDEEYLMFLGKQLKSDVLSFEVNIADHCNLNCQCCNHFSPIAKEKYIDKEQYEKDLIRLYELFGERIGKLMLLGGEPLLNPNIVELLHLTRKRLPNTTLFLFTNGTMFPRMTDEFWNACKINSISIKVTEYPIKFDYQRWFEFGQLKGIDIVNENPETVKTTYRLPISGDGGLNPFRNYAKCYHANQCVVLREGRLYPCPISAWVDYLNYSFDTSFPEIEQNSIDIYEAEDADTIMEFLKMPIKMCEYCDIYNYEYDIPWGVSKKARKEWID